ncbi:hypothetical protein ACWKSP_14000 [Micromonosporaceae bacterium Da 78-11]
MLVPADGVAAEKRQAAVHAGITLIDWRGLHHGPGLISQRRVVL